MMSYFDAFGPQGGLCGASRERCAAIAGILKAPFDILADKLRGYKGLCMDMFRQPKKVLAACEALAPHLLQVALMRRRSGQERADRAVDAPRLRALPFAARSSSNSTGRR